MRRKPTTPGSSSGYNQQRKPRYQGGSSNGGEHRSHNSHHNPGHSGNGGRPRKNYAASREKYLAQARDALAAGDRVLAENYFQHADHCYRMMVEEGYQVRNNYTPPPQNGELAGDHQPMEHEQHADNGNVQGEEGTNEGSSEDHVPDVVSQLPAFLTANFDHGQNQQAAEPVAAQSWEE